MRREVRLFFPFSFPSCSCRGAIYILEEGKRKEEDRERVVYVDTKYPAPPPSSLGSASSDDCGQAAEENKEKDPELSLRVIHSNFIQHRRKEMAISNLNNEGLATNVSYYELITLWANLLKGS